MVVISRIFSRDYGRLQVAKIIHYAVRRNSSTLTQDSVQESQNNKIPEQNIEQKKVISDRYQFIYPEFLLDPDLKYHNSLREKLERMDMMARRMHVAIPEFYVGSVLAITYSEPHASGKINKFVGICIEQKGSGLRAICVLRNVVNQGIEVIYELYDSAIQKIECLKLDSHLRYLQDAPAEYSTFPFDMEPEYLPEGAPVPVNKIKVQLNPHPWLEKASRVERYNTELQLSEERIMKAKAAATLWEKETIPEEDQNDILDEIYTKLHEMEITKRRQKHKRSFVRPQKTG
ncbi:PREDICTED: LOW QUALITY PROTEIN: 39S ribosomal protein L19, mitochondrial-like [Atta colombica]|uniref:LOW QUALITY PROTEIN: 39S ribosomal protein L19, mitochondrial-like n=1 Tax=Atta colombica TaxID=520822 RepID=UPI00084C5E70|nr:PREDICTED: LOW QUALITY PROTEIN: 39S ribosomal protein L19, mitochondrial-like [Atta colombica]